MGQAQSHPVDETMFISTVNKYSMIQERRKKFYNESKMPLPPNPIEIINRLLKRRNYVKSAYKGGELHAKGFVQVILHGNHITVKHDLEGNKGITFNQNELAYFPHSLNYFERIN